jgi:Domain of unknown function (DUF4082)/Bacterial Ig-like domain/Bacterial Ig domain
MNHRIRLVRYWLSIPLGIRSALLLVLAAVAMTGLLTPSLQAQQTCPCSIWGDLTTPGGFANDGSAVELGAKFTSDSSGVVSGVRFYKFSQNTGTHVGNLWSASGTLLGTVTFSNETASGWQTANFPTPIAVTANTTYIVSYHTNTGFFAMTQFGLGSSVDNAPLHAVASGGAAGGNGVYLYGAASAFPTQSYNASNYWVDMVFSPNGGETVPPTVSMTAPINGATVSGAALTVSANASDNVGVVGVQFKLDGVNLGAEDTTSPYSTTWNTTTSVNGSHTLTAVARDAAGNTATATSVTVTVSNVTSGCPCSLWTLSTTPGPMFSESGSLELGVKFTADANGAISGLRFYKYAQNTSTHIGSLWTSDGTLLGTVTFTNETASGWQQQSFASPIPITANTTYVASYHTDTPFYSATSGGFTNAVDNAPLHALSNAAAGGNGVFISGPTAFPNQSFGSANYWVDVVFNPGSSDSSAPTVAMTAPANGATVSGTALAVSANASDNVGVVGVQFKIDGANLGAEDTASPYATTWNTTTVANGSHILTAVARDAAGNTATATNVTVTVNNADATPPTVAMTAPANGATVSGTTLVVSANASDNVAVVGVQFKLDGANLSAEDTASPYSVTWNTTTVANGSHTLTAVARDAAGNTATATSVTVTVNNADVTPPTVAMTAPANGATVSGNSLAVSATASDNVAVVGVQFKIDGANLGAEDTATPYSVTWNTTTVANGSHTLTAVARDAAGNTATATSVTVTVNNADVTPPTVAMTAPANGATVSGNSLAVSATASDNVAVVGVQFKIDGANLGAEVTTSPYSITWNTTTVVNGSHALTAVARDAAGNTATATSVSVSVNNADTTPPTVALTAPANGATVSGSAVTLSATASDNIAVIGVEFKVDGVNLGGLDTVSPYSVTWNTTTVANGTHTLTAIASDGAGNTTTSTTVTVTVSNADVTPPTVAMTAPANGATVSGATLAVSATASDNIGVVGVQFKLDGANLGAEVTTSPYSVTWNMTTVANGSHTLTAVARDAAANTATATNVIVTVSNADVTPPTVAMTAPANGATVSGTTLAVSATASDNVAVVGVQFKLDGANLGAEATTSPYSVTWNTTTAVNGTHTLTAVARDAAGNTATATIVTVTVSNASSICPCSLWTPSTTPGAMFSEAGSLELGVKVTADADGFITGIRFYKYAQNTSVHIGNLWTSTGTLLGTVTFANETASGWQQQAFASPIAVTANTTYVASFHTDTAFYAATAGGFTTAVDNAPLHALSDAAAVGNGVFIAGASAFPNQTFGATNYWVDVTFINALDSTPPTVAMAAPANGSTVFGTAVTVSATASDNVAVTSVQFKLDGANLGAPDTVAPYSIVWDASAVPNGPHTLTAVASDLAGNTATATSVAITVNNPDVTPPTVAMTAPANGATVSGTTATVSATASDNIGVVGVQFLLDGVATGPEVTTPPYAVIWNTTAVGNGPHTIAATARDAAGNTATSSVVTVTVANTGLATLVIDATASGDGSSSSSSITTPAFSTTAGNELLLAFVSTDANTSGITVTNVTGASLTWQLVARTNVQLGTSEVWRAFASSALGNVSVSASLSQSVSSSITVVAFKGAEVTGTNGSGAIGATKSANARPGAPTATVTTTRAGSWVFGVGNDWDNATSHTPGSGQTMVHQFLSSVGDTYWVQRTTNTTPTIGTNVTINDTAPTGDRYNLTLVEVLPAITAPDLTPPSIVATTPAAGAVGVSTAITVSVKFSEGMNPTTITSTNLQLLNPSNAVVPSTISYDSTTATALISPTLPLSTNSTYTVVVQNGVKDTSGNFMASPVSWSFTTSPSASNPNQGSGGPILVVSTAASPYSYYYAEILRAEGLNEFAVNDISTVTSTVLSGYDVVILSQQTLTTAQATMFTNWVQGGGKLIAMRPDTKLATLLGLSSVGATLSNSYLAIDTTKAPGTGLVSDSMQFHGAADEYTTSVGNVVATLYSDATHATAFPAVTLTTAGSGKAAAFTFDLARSIISTRQGNPAWAGQERDGQAPIRSDDLFFGAKAGDFQPDWVDLTKVQIPQADEQQRLLVNLILQMTSGGRPLPRFWYLPRGNKAAVVMTGDDHAVLGPMARFNLFLSQSTPGCVVANWECIRSTAYVFPNTPMTDTQAAAFAAQGFEIGVHVTMDPQGTILCGNDYTPATLQSFYTNRLSSFASAFPSLPAPKTHRMHCIMWSDWSSQPNVENQNGIRLDTSYYYWPSTWITDRPGMFTGSGIPMRLTNSDGSMVDVYEATTQMTDESGQTYPLHIDTLLNNATGALGYYGVFTANMHTDTSDNTSATAIVNSAKAHSVPVISAQQLLTWLDGRNGSSFGTISWSSNVLTFTVSQATGATGLQVMVPTQAGTLHMTGVTLNGSAVSATTQTIKGVSYAFITVAPGQIRVTYAP